LLARRGASPCGPSPGSRYRPPGRSPSTWTASRPTAARSWPPAFTPGLSASGPGARPMLDRVLLLSASAGAGHVRAAQALERAFRDAGAAREVRHVDVLEHTTALFRRLYSRVYLDLVNNAPEVLGWLYEYLDSPWKHERRRLAFDKLNTRPFVRLIESYRPQWTPCTHFLPSPSTS